MAVKASVSVTLSCYRDIESVTRYYTLGASTPSKPTAKPPSGWTDAEPSYTSGSTNSLYFCDLTVYSDGTWAYSAVSKSSSYEAAKEAYNKAQNAQSDATSAKQYTDTVQSQYGYPFRKDIVVYGDRTDYYYPVYLAYGEQYVSREVLICRYYGDQAPDDWNTSTHKGSLTLRIKANYGNWGGATYKCEILDFSEMYSTMVADIRVNVLYGYGMCVWLRGGGTTGAKYKIYSDQRIEYLNSDWHCDVPIIATTAGGRIGWLNGTEENPTYTWIAANPLTAPNTARLNSLQALKTANLAISTVDVEYYLSTSATSLSGGSWQTTAPAWVDGKYMWSRTKTTNGAGTVTYKPSETGTCIAGAKGATGSIGATGKGISSITEEYYLSTSKETPTGGSWTTTPPTWESGKYIWTRSKIVYTNPASTTYTTALCDSSWEAANEVDAKKVDKDKIIAAINLEGENAKIKAEKITLEGATIADNFTATNLHITGDSTFDGKVTASLLNVYQEFNYAYEGETLPFAFVVKTSQEDDANTLIGTYCVDDSYSGLIGSRADFGADGYMNLYSSDNMVIHSETNINITAGTGTISLGANTTVDGSLTTSGGIYTTEATFFSNAIVKGGLTVIGASTFNSNVNIGGGLTVSGNIDTSGGFHGNAIFIGGHLLSDWNGGLSLGYGSSASGCKTHIYGAPIQLWSTGNIETSSTIAFVHGTGIYNRTVGAWMAKMDNMTNHSNLNCFGSSSYKTSIYGSGVIWKNGSASTYFATTSSSDRRLKEEVYTDMSPYEDFFMRLVPVAFKYHDGLYNAEKHAPLIQWGFYAQDTIEAFNESGLDWTTHELVVVEDGELSTEELKYVNEDDMLKMNYQNMTALNTYMIQKNRLEIEELKAQIQKLLSAIS